MKVKLPIQKKEIVKGEIKKEKTSIEFDIDVTLASQMRYEANFPELAKNEDLYGYSQRISNNKDLTSGKVLSQLKLLYCWIDTDLTFIEFLKLIDLTDQDYVKEFTKCLKNAFDLILNSSAEKN